MSERAINTNRPLVCVICLYSVVVGVRVGVGSSVVIHNRPYLLLRPGRRAGAARDGQRSRIPTLYPLRSPAPGTCDYNPYC